MQFRLSKFQIRAEPLTIKKSKQPRSVSDFLEAIYQIDPEDEVLCFRGEANGAWQTKPSVMRALKDDAERHIISELTLEASSEFLSDTSMFKKLVRAQHFGLPTRLLDVSLNPLVALYFACSDHSQMGSAGQLIIYKFKRNRVKFADSDAVSIVSNLANLRDDERIELNTEAKAYLNKYTTEERKNPDLRTDFNKLKSADRLAQFVRVEKPYFRANINPVDLRKYYFVYPHKDNRRIIAQSGAFIIAGLLSYQRASSSKGFAVEKIEIPANAKETIISQLDKININKRTLFPEIESTSRYIKERWTASNEVIEDVDNSDDEGGE